MTLNKKLWISLAVMALGIISPFVFDWWFNLHDEWYMHRDGLDVAVFGLIILCSAASTAINHKFRQSAKLGWRKDYEFWFVFLEIVSILCCLGSLFLVFASGIRNMMIL